MSKSKESTTRKKSVSNLTKQTGITKTFLAVSLKKSREAFDYALERGLRPAEEKQLNNALKKSGNTLLSFETKNLKKEQG
jgi:hypothetical protein